MKSTSEKKSESIPYEAFRIRSSIYKKDFLKKIHLEWLSADCKVDDTCKIRSNGASTKENCLKLANDTVKLFNKPFKICVVQDFLDNEFNVKELVHEMCEMEWQRKQIDLYEFHQTTDLVNLSFNSKPALKIFYKTLTNVMLPWMKEVTGLPLTHVSASCSMYNYGDFLLVHDDLLGDRQIAFVYYLSPWHGAENWTDDMGGALELFECDPTTNQPKYPIVKKFPPRNNQFTFFRVCQQSFHQVGEVTNLVYPRLTINGWFHGNSTKQKGGSSSNGTLGGVIDTTSNSTTTSAFENNAVLLQNLFTYNSPVIDELDLSEWINSTYLQPSAKTCIQQHIEDKSEASLEMFLIREFYDLLLTELKENKELEWVLEGPANQRKYETLRFSSQSTGPPKDLHALFTSKSIFNLLHQYTELDFDGPNLQAPTCSVQICRFTQGCYTLLGDSSTFTESALDAILFFNAKDQVGTVTYLSPDCVNGTNVTGEADATTSSDWSEIGINVTGTQMTNAMASSATNIKPSGSKYKSAVLKNICVNRQNVNHETNRQKSTSNSTLAILDDETGPEESCISYEPYEGREILTMLNQDVTVSSTAAASTVSDPIDEDDDDDYNNDSGKLKRVQHSSNSVEEDEDDNINETYDELAREDVLLTVQPKNNALNLVYRLYGQTKFVKYVSKNCIDPDEYVYILFATFKE